MYHPLVHEKSGEVNLDFDFPEWLPGKHWAVNVLFSLKKLLHLEPYFACQDPKFVFNQKAQKDFSENFE